MELRGYQSGLVVDIRAAWAAGAQNVLAVQATRTGKTVLFSSILAEEQEECIAVVHRQELVAQISLTLARQGVAHRIIAPDAVIKRIIHQNVARTGQAFYNPQAGRIVASVDTMLARIEALAPLLRRVRKWVVDEGHHLLLDNKWGKAIGRIPDAQGLGVTATPQRADGQGLGRHAGGLFDVLVLGLQAREAIDQGWLLDHTVYAVAGDYKRPEASEVGTTGDLKRKAIQDSIRKSHVTGDIADHYLRLVPGKTAVVFSHDVETGTEIAAAFIAKGVPAAVVSAKTPDGERAHALRRFEKRELLVLVNVDLFGEGTDLPDLEAVILARPTESFSLFCQQTARASTPVWQGDIPATVAGRLAAIATSSKPKAIIIDHVGNVARHATALHRNGETVIDLAYAEWSLDARDRKSRTAADDAIPLRSCLNIACMQVYERVLPECPYCGTHPVPASRSAPEFVDGDLTELAPEVLAQMRSAVVAVDKPVDQYKEELTAKRCPPQGVLAHAKRHLAKQEAQTELRETMAYWAGQHKAAGRGDAERYRRFWHRFGIDALSAQALNTEAARELMGQIAIDTLGNRP